MPTQKTLKRRVRARMTKTGESYTAARHQLLRKAAEPATPAGATEATAELTTSDEAMRRGSGRGHAEWFAMLDAWNATERRHPEIARWLRDEHGVDGWWAQSITVGYERARGMRARHQTAGGFSVGANRTMAVDADRILAAFTNTRLRQRWLPGVRLRRRPTTAILTARFDWPDPPSRVVVYVAPRGETRATATVQHEKLPDAEAAERFKQAWRAWLVALKDLLEAG